MNKNIMTSLDSINKVTNFLPCNTSDSDVEFEVLLHLCGFKFAFLGMVSGNKVKKQSASITTNTNKNGRLNSN
ncbi:hypothetical protein [Bathymodiolus thermophilus thioautotrophic gill symbiont]|uniref:Uncharacterized protein n=1 Tax=Bathymodiolus thermophilus thioautotrophic gill symbiont TaxID=2360 RepID=A0A8H9CIG5_9GAMM|nr:hypothetical protein [Bathymodiolus thermophilus thioautotrophic gill symbiont]CAB5505103.1 hypothetical protein THERMOS_2069 [Bathymodiolus thermophilus thioautotrophic gill symbiont]